MADVHPQHLTLRSIQQRRHEFHPGEVMAEFPLENE
jgi:hypothetical protein